MMREAKAGREGWRKLLKEMSSKKPGYTVVSSHPKYLNVSLDLGK